MAEPDKNNGTPGARSIAVIGAGVIGCAVAFALAREGHRVQLFDRAPPGAAGASFGNAGHIATELLEPLPAPGLLVGFWRELFAFGGVLDIPLRRLPAFAPWAPLILYGLAAFSFVRALLTLRGTLGRVRMAGIGHQKGPSGPQRTDRARPAPSKSGLPVTRTQTVQRMR